jgi:phenylpyruvate tautomerase PptA (4-oxalocrotonate tautomerase family)
MPILDVEIVGPTQAGIAQSLADQAGVALETAPGKTWVKVRFLPSEQYAENGMPQGSTQPVFVSILTRSEIDSNRKSRVALALATQFSKVLGRSAENIHVIFELSAAGRIAFGGNLKT